MKSDLIFGQNIIDGMVEELGEDRRKEIEEIIRLNIKYIKEELCYDPEVLSIQLTGLGTLTSNFNLLVSERKLNRKSSKPNRREHVEKVIQPRLEKMNKFWDENFEEGEFVATKYGKKPFLYMLKNQMGYMDKFRKKVKRFYRNPEIVWQIVADHQNRINSGSEDI